MRPKPNAQPVPMPKLAVWAFVRRLKLKDLAIALDCSTESVRRYLLPFDDPERRAPPADVIERAEAFTEGEVRAADWEPAPAGVDA